MGVQNDPGRLGKPSKWRVEGIRLSESEYEAIPVELVDVHRFSYDSGRSKEDKYLNDRLSIERSNRY